MNNVPVSRLQGGTDFFVILLTFMKLPLSLLLLSEIGIFAKSMLITRLTKTSAFFKVVLARIL